MTKLANLPTRGQVDLLRGCVDFYVRDGVPLARSFPRKPRQPRSAAVRDRQPQFAYSQRVMKFVHAEIADKWRSCLTGKGWHWKDLATVAYYGLDYYPAALLFMLFYVTPLFVDHRLEFHTETDTECELTLVYSYRPPWHTDVRRMLRGEIETWAGLARVTQEGTQDELPPVGGHLHTFTLWDHTLELPAFFTFKGKKEGQDSPSLVPVWTLNPDLTLA